MLLFNFQEFISELRDNEEKQELIQQYEKLFGPIQGDIYDQKRYREYLQLFEPISYAGPEEMDEDFDWDLLLRLVVGSTSSDYQIMKDPETWVNELIITVKNDTQSITKSVSELWSFQLLKLYEIYTEDMLNIEIFKAEEEASDTSERFVESERAIRLKKRQAYLATADRAELAEKTKASQEQELEDLMGQL